MSERYPFFPELPEAAKEEAQKLIESFKEELSKVANDTISHFYTDITPFIESDHWRNFRTQIMDGFRNYHNGKIQNAYDFSEIRKQILKEFKEEIINDLNQDLIKENVELKNRVNRLEEEVLQLRPF